MSRCAKRKWDGSMVVGHLVMNLRLWDEWIFLLHFNTYPLHSLIHPKYIYIGINITQSI